MAAAEVRQRRIDSLVVRATKQDSYLRNLEASLEDARQRYLGAGPVERLQLERETRNLEDEIQRLASDNEVLDKLREAQTLEADARRCESTDAPEEASRKWRELLRLEPDNVEAIEAADRCEKAAAILRRQDELAGKMMQFLTAGALDHRLVARVTRTIRSAHKSVARQSPEMGFVEMLVNGRMTPDDFKAAWEELETPVNGQADAMPQVDFKILYGRLARGEMVLFVGPILQAPEALADALARNIGPEVAQERARRSCPPSEVAEYCEMRPEFGTLDLIRRVSNLLPHDDASAPLYNLIASLPRPLVVISASHDTLLERALDAQGKKYVLVSVILSGTTETVGTVPTGHLILRYSDKPMAEAPMADEALSQDDPITKGYSVVFKLRGVCDDTAAVSNPIHRTFTMSEARHFAFARQGDRQVPSYVSRHFAGRGLLVLGHRPAFWEDRLVLNAILERCKTTGDHAMVVSTEREGFAAQYWQSRKLAQFSYRLEDFVSHLQGAVS